MCELCVDVAQLNNIPYRLPSVVSLPPKSVRERFPTFFDILFRNCHSFERVICFHVSIRNFDVLYYYPALRAPLLDHPALRAPLQRRGISRSGTACRRWKE